MTKKECLKKLAELEIRAGALADHGRWDLEELEEYEKVLAVLEELVR